MCHIQIEPISRKNKTTLSPSRSSEGPFGKMSAFSIPLHPAPNSAHLKKSTVPKPETHTQRQMRSCDSAHKCVAVLTPTVYISHHKNLVSTAIDAVDWPIIRRAATMFIRDAYIYVCMYPVYNIHLCRRWREASRRLTSLGRSLERSPPRANGSADFLYKSKTWNR